MSRALHVAPFLTELRTLLTEPSAWHPLACANTRGRVLGEFEQLAPAWDRMVPTEAVPVAWNLPCALRYVLNVWELEGKFLDVPVEKTALRYAVHGLLQAEAGTDIWLVHDHRTALDAIDAVLAHCARPMVATTSLAESSVSPSPSVAVGRTVAA